MTDPCAAPTPSSISSPPGGQLCDGTQLRQLADMTTDLFCTASPEGRFLGLNPAWERTLGYSIEELIARPFIELVHPEDRESTISELGAIAEGASSEHFENRYMHRDGSIRWLSWSGFSDGDVVYAIARDVTALKEKELALESARKAVDSNNALLASIRQVHKLALDDKAPGEIFDILLSKILEASGSEYGFIGEVHQGEDGSPFLKTHAITNIAWNEETRRFYDENAPTGLNFTNLKTLFGAVLVSGKPMIANDPQSHPRAGGIPEGHPDLNAFLGLPLSDGDGMVGMLGIANRSSGYDQDLIDHLEPLVSTTARMIRAFQQRRARDEAEAELRSSEERWRRSIDFAAYPVLLWDRGRIITYANESAIELLDTKLESVLGKSLDRFIVDSDIDRESALVSMRSDGWSHRITTMRTPSGETRPVDLQAVDLGNGISQAMLFDMREWVEIEQNLQRATQRDNLTGLLNRKAIEEHAEIEILRARRRAHHVGLLLIDIDHFKRVNDVWGHLAGDVALQNVSEILTKCVRPYDWVGRWGGEEFLIVLPDTDQDQAHIVAERIRTTVAGSEVEATSVRSVPVTVSIGLAAVSTGATPNLRVFFERVDQALYAAKEAGRNQTVRWRRDLAA